MLHGEQADGQFYGAGRTQQVAVLGLGAADGDDIGGIAEVTRDGIDAVLVPPADAPALAAAMSALLDDPARRAALGDEARRRFLQHFDIARVAPAIVDMLRASIAAHQVG